LPNPAGLMKLMTWMQRQRSLLEELLRSDRQRIHRVTPKYVGEGVHCSPAPAVSGNNQPEAELLELRDGSVDQVLVGVHEMQDSQFRCNMRGRG
jgi:hypothetical protein